MIGYGGSMYLSNKNKWLRWEKLSPSEDFVQRKCVVHSVMSCFKDEEICSYTGNQYQCLLSCVEQHTYMFTTQDATILNDGNNTTVLTSSLTETTRSNSGGGRFEDICGSKDQGPASQQVGCKQQLAGQKPTHRSAECGKACDFEPLGPAPFQVGGEYPCWEPSAHLETQSERFEAYQSLENFCGNVGCKKISDPSVDFSNSVREVRKNYDTGIILLSIGVPVLILSVSFCLFFVLRDFDNMLHHFARYRRRGHTQEVRVQPALARAPQPVTILYYVL